MVLGSFDWPCDLTFLKIKNDNWHPQIEEISEVGR